MPEPHETPPRTMGIKIACAAVSLALLGVLLAYLGAVPPMFGFVMYAVGILLSLAATIIALVALVRGRGSFAAVVTPAVAFVALAAPGFAGGGVPRINDITTNIGNPPLFVAARKHEPNKGREMTYPAAEFADQQTAAYPDIATKHVSTGVEKTLERLRKALMDMPGSKIVAFDPDEGRIEATQTSGMFKFVDDIVVRVQPNAEGSVVDIRSKSRDGQSDFGVNAARIRILLASLDS